MPSLLDKFVAGVLPLVPRPIVRRVSARYLAGETLAAALARASALRDRGLRTTMDILGEYAGERRRAESFRDLYLELIDAQAAAGVDRNVSLKLTQFGLKIDREFCLETLRPVVARAAASGAKVRIDMEDSSCTDDTLRIYRTLRREAENVGLVIQAYLRRSLADVAALAPLKPDFRLCKGIYVEPADLAFTGRAEINHNYLALLDAMWETGGFVGIATHDGDLIAAARERIRARGLGPDRYEFQMLLGVREELRDALLAAGHPVRLYLPFGAEWYAYSLRRLRENPAVAGHVFRAMWR